jgi:hypothetical protein
MLIGVLEKIEPYKAAKEYSSKPIKSEIIIQIL